MSRQRNEPTDPAAELANYDFSKSEGTSADSGGQVKTETWPEHLSRDEITETGRTIIQNWIDSPYSELKEKTIKQFAESSDSSLFTIRTWLYRAFPSQRDYNDLKMAEKKGVVVFAAYGDKLTLSQLQDQFEVNYNELNLAKNGVPDIVESLRSKHPRKKLQQEVEKFRVENSGGELTDYSPSDTLSQDERRSFMDYFIENPDADVQDAVDAVGVEAHPQVIGSIKGTAKLKQNSNSKSQKSQPDKSERDDINIQLGLDKETARVVVTTQKLPDSIRDEMVDKILTQVGL